MQLHLKGPQLCFVYMQEFVYYILFGTCRKKKQHTFRETTYSEQWDFTSPWQCSISAIQYNNFNNLCIYRTLFFLRSLTQLQWLIILFPSKLVDVDADLLYVYIIMLQLAMICSSNTLGTTYCLTFCYADLETDCDLLNNIFYIIQTSTGHITRSRNWNSEVLGIKLQLS